MELYVPLVSKTNRFSIHQLIGFIPANGGPTRIKFYLPRASPPESGADISSLPLKNKAADTEIDRKTDSKIEKPQQITVTITPPDDDDGSAKNIVLPISNSDPSHLLDPAHLPK